MRTNTALLSLSVGAFAIGQRNFPDGYVAGNRRVIIVSIPRRRDVGCGGVTGRDAGVPVMTLLLIRRSPKAALIFPMSIFTAGNVLSALAPGLQYTAVCPLYHQSESRAFSVSALWWRHGWWQQRQKPGRLQGVYGADHCQYRRRSCDHQTVSGCWLAGILCGQSSAC